MSDLDVSHVLAAGASAPTPDLLGFADPQERIRTISVYNNTSLTLNFYIGSQAASGTPNFSLGPYQSATQPIRSASNVLVSYSGTVQNAGFIYLHYTTDLLPANSSVIQPGQVSVPGAFGGRLTLPVGLTSQEVMVNFIIDTTPGFNKVASGLFVNSAVFDNIPMNNYCEVVAFNTRTGRLSGNAGKIEVYGNAAQQNYNFARGYQVYQVNQNAPQQDLIGDTIALALNVDGAISGSPVTAYFTLETTQA